MNLIKCQYLQLALESQVASWMFCTTQQHGDDQTVYDWHRASLRNINIHTVYREGLGQTSNWSQLNHAALSGSPTVEHMCQGQAHVHHH